VNWVKFIDSVIVANHSFGFDIKTKIILVKCYNGIISVCLRIVIFSSVHLIYTNTELYVAMFSHGWLSIGRKIQLMVLPDESGNKNAPRKCHSHTLAYLSTMCSGTPSGQCLKFSVSHIEGTPEGFLQHYNGHS
jgi:hypothetical protein